MSDYEPKGVGGTTGGKRVALAWTPWMDDWFATYSPRNGYGAIAEGPWAHWVDLALSILQHPLTEHVRPEVRAAVADFEVFNFYDETNADLTTEQIEQELGGNEDD